MKVTKSARGRVRAKRLDMSVIKAAHGPVNTQVYLGVVVQPQGETSHWSMDTEETGGPLVWVELQPHREEVECRLGGLGGGAGDGVWRIPPTGTEVAVLSFDGDFGADPTIVAVLSSGSVPSELNATTLVIRAPSVTVNADAGDVNVLASGTVHLGGTGLVALTDGVVVAQGIDPFTGQTYGNLGSASSKVRAKK